MTEPADPNTGAANLSVDHHAAALRTALGLVPADMVKGLLLDYLRSNPQLLESFLEQAASVITTVIVTQLRTWILSGAPPTPTP